MSIAEAGKVLSRIASSICQTFVCDADSEDFLGDLPPFRQLTTGSALAVAAGAALTGERCCAFVQGARLGEAQAQLRQLVGRQLPLVIQAHCAALDGCGLFQVMPTSLQQAVDFTVLAHWLAEQSLIPGLVSYDWGRIEAEIGLSEAANSFLGLPHDAIEPPTPAQLLLFGRTRRRVVSRFDLDKPVALGSIQGADEAVGAAAGRRLFFGSHLAGLAAKGMLEFEKRTGRRLSFVAEFELKRAELVLVVPGTAFEAAAALAESLREQRGWKIGVLGLTWLRPFPRQAVADALSAAKQVAVLERADFSIDEDPPLFNQVRGCLGGDRRRWISALYGESLHAGDLAEMTAEVRKGKGRDRFWLGIGSKPPLEGRFPKREVLLGAVANDYPALRELGLRSAGPFELGGGNCRRVLSVAPTREAASESIRSLANGWAFAKGSVRRRRPGVFQARLDVSTQQAGLIESGAAVDLALIDMRCMATCRSNPLDELKPSAKILVGLGQGDQAPSAVWAAMPDSWRSSVRRLKLEIYQTSIEEQSQAAAALLADSDSGRPQAIDWQSLPQPADADGVPALVRRMADAQQGFESLPRFWGQVAQPRQECEADGFPDPLATANAIPACSSAFAPAPSGAPLFPLLEAEKCTGCGKCWTCCPDSAVGAALLGVHELLETVVEAAAKRGKEVRTLRRIRRQAAQAAAALIRDSQGAAPVSELLLQSCIQTASRMKLPPEEAGEAQEALQSGLEAVELTPMVTDTHFRHSQQEQKEADGLLFLAFDPDSCQGCGMCIAACPDDALHPSRPSIEVLSRARLEWRCWESLPDTSGKRISQTGQQLGLLPSILLSRHCSHAQLGGGFGEPGSGARLAGRLTVALLEFEQQRILNLQAQRCDELAQTLRQSLRSTLTDALADEAPDVLEAALQGVSGSRPSLSELDAQLARQGEGVRLDRARLAELAHLEQQVREEKERLTQGLSGLGRARFGMVSCGPRAVGLASLFPHHRYYAPLVSEQLPEAAELARGLAEAMARRCLSGAVLLRRAALVAEAPADLPARLKELEALKWQDLTAEEKADCPPLLLLMDEQALSQSEFGSFSRLLACGLPVKILLLDERDNLLRPFEPLAAVLACRQAFALSSSLAHPEHLAEGFQKALRHPGPAFIQLYTPTPQRHGFDPAQTLERARLAVEARLQPLVSYDPDAEGTFGLRLSLDGNPALDEDWGLQTFVEWARGEARFAWAFESEDVHPKLIQAARRQQELWNLYRELSGVVNPFVARTRAELESEVSAAQQQKLDALQKQYESDFEARMTAVLRERLLSLAGVE